MSNVYYMSMTVTDAVPLRSARLATSTVMIAASAPFTGFWRRIHDHVSVLHAQICNKIGIGAVYLRDR
jgi:hypothetical protein